LSDKFFQKIDKIKKNGAEQDLETYAKIILKIPPDENSQRFKKFILKKTIPSI